MTRGFFLGAAILFLASALARAGQPAIVYTNSSGGLTAIDLEGAGRAIVGAGSYAKWGEGGSGTLADPYPLVYISGSGCGTLSLADVYVDSSGAPRATHLRSITTSRTACNPSLSPDGRWIAFTATGAGMPSSISVIGTDGTGETALYVSPSGYTSSRPVFSPDGSRIAFFTLYMASSRYSHALHTVDLNGAENTVLRSGSFARIGQLDWSEQNEIVFEADNGSGVSKIYGLDQNVPGSAPVLITQGMNPTCSDTGTTLVFSGATGNRGLTRYDRSTRTSKVLVPGYAAFPNLRK